jgi:hypothetical protein
MNLVPIDDEAWDFGDLVLQLPNDITLTFPGHLDGGGPLFMDDFTHAVKTYGGKSHYARAFEWCSGPAIMGFRLLAENLVDTLACSDYYERANQNVRDNAQANQLAGRVQCYQSHSLTQIPDHEKWDLVVGNPPHCFPPMEDIIQQISDYQKNPALALNTLRILADPGMQTHRDFFQHVGNYLTPDADIFIYEPYVLDEIDCMVHDGGLRIAGLYPMVYLRDNLKAQAPHIDPAIHENGRIYHLKPAR